MDDTNEFAGGKVENPQPRAIIAVPNEHTTKLFGRELFLRAVL
jgi:hypothetical protein